MPADPDHFFPIIGVGASAGGLEAFRKLVKAIPSDPGMAYVLVQHLAADHESMLSEILQKSTSLPVIEIKHRMPVLPDHIYVIPSNNLVTIKDNMLILDRIVKGDKLNTIDVFLNSLAENHQQHSVGILLSGTGSDGTVGLKTIKDQGGTTLVQDESSATHFAMPKHAIDAAVVDFVIPPEEMPPAILKLFGASTKPSSPPIRRKTVSDPEVVKEILALLKRRRGVDFTYYKGSTLLRRIHRRRVMTDMESLKAYLAFMTENESEQDALFKDILIPVTAFFRDVSSFELLKTKVFPVLFEKKDVEAPKRIWVAGCSTGEEAYSIAILLQEFFEDPAVYSNVQIFATDISDLSVAKARNGTYSKQNMAGVSPGRRSRFFTETEAGYRVNKSVREMCIFATQNFLQHPPFGRIDLVSCRNVLIYLEPYLQKKAFSTFHYALRPNGVLFLGRSESVNGQTQEFVLINHHDRFYRKVQSGEKFFSDFNPGRTAVEKPEPENTKVEHPGKDNYEKAADAALLEKYAPVAVLVNDQMNVLQFRGATSAYLEFPTGKATHNLIKMARTGLSYEIRRLLLQTKESGLVARKTSLSIDKGMRKVDIEVVPIKTTIEPCYLVLFSESVVPTTTPVIAERIPPDPADNDLAVKKQMSDLEQDLAQTKKDLREITESQETANEELQSANEELLSGSEELQTLNEELETSKEEIQSSNEELNILNQELIDRNDQLVHTRQYTEAIITTLHEPIIILDSKFKIRSANKCFYETFGLNERESQGLSFFEWNDSMWNIASLKSNLENIFPHNTHFENLPVKLMVRNAARDYELNGRQIVNENSNEQLILLAMQDDTDKNTLRNAEKVFAMHLEEKITEQTAELVILNENLRHSNENLRQFNSIASHDLQEPLRKIRTFAVMLERSLQAPGGNESTMLIGKITRSAERMSQLIKDLLDYSKLERSEKIFVKTDLDAELKNTISDLDLLITETGTSIHCPVDLPVIDAVPLQIHLLFNNLLNNAIKFRKPNTESKIEISFRNMSWQPNKIHNISEKSARAVEITISDNGIGFEQQFAVQIFDLFERLHRADQYEGTGVGLALCKKAVENHNGTISARSMENKGAAFIITLPVLQPTS